MSEVRSSTGPFFVSASSETDKQGASAYIETWEGTEAEVKAKAASVRGSATRISTAPKGDGAWQTRLEFPFDPEDPNNSYVDTLELEVSAVLRSGYQSPVYRSKFSDYNAITRDSAKARGTLPVIADLARKYQSGQPAREESGKYLWAGTEYDTRELAILAELSDRLTVTGSEKSYATALFENMAFRGATSFLEYNRVFRRTVTAGSPLAIQANQTGAGQIWTTAEVIAFENIPSNTWFQLPPNVQWHKDTPRVLAAYGQKTQISYNYIEIATATACYYEAYNSAVLIDNFG
jgi:hypothetical protein